MLSVEKCEPALAELVDAVPAEFWAAKLALVLLAERAKGDDSSVAAHVSALPGGFTNPIFWSPDAIKQLRGYPTVQTQLLKQAKFLSAFATERLGFLRDSRHKKTPAGR